MRNEKQKVTNSLVDAYIKGLENHELSSLYIKFLNNDQSEVGVFLSRSPEIDGWLKSAEGPFQLFDMFDEVKEQVIKEVKYRCKGLDFSCLTN